MKKISFLMVCVLALTSCRLDLGNLSKMGGNKIEPSDNIVTKTYKLNAFEDVNMSCVGHVDIVQDVKKSGTIELTAPDNYIEYYKFESADSALRIRYSKNNLNLNSQKVKIKVYTADLVKVTNSGASGIHIDNLDTDRLEAVVSGVGEIVISGVADKVTLRNSGVGSIDAEKFKAQKVKASVSGVGSIKCYASEEIEGSVSGVGSLEYAGHPKKKDTHRSGVGSISEL